MLLGELHEQGVTRQQIEDALAKIPFVSIYYSHDPKNRVVKIKSYFRIRL